MTSSEIQGVVSTRAIPLREANHGARTTHECTVHCTVLCVLSTVQLRSDVLPITCEAFETVVNCAVNWNSIPFGK